MLKKFVSLSLVLTGCASANIVQTVYGPPKRGVVKVHGGWFDHGGEKCQTAMKDFCQPAGFRVLSERYSGEMVGMTANTYGNTTLVTPNSETFLYVTFQCKDSDRETPSESRNHRPRQHSPQEVAPENSDVTDCKAACVQKFQNNEITDVGACSTECSAD